MGAWEIGLALALIAASAATTVYTSRQQTIAANRAIKAAPAPDKSLLTQESDQSLLSDQRRRRSMGAFGRNDTILATPGLTGSPLGGSSAASAGGAKSLLGQ